MKNSSIPVTTGATLLSDCSKAGVSPQSIYVYNNGTADIFVGGNDVTTTNGFPVAAGKYFVFNAIERDGLYGVVASGSENARVIETRAQ